MTVPGRARMTKFTVNLTAVKDRVHDATRS
jgi:hypothetical protein